MLVTKKSLVTGRVHTREIPGATAQGLARCRAGALMQDVFPGLSPDDREFLISGITPEEWNDTFGGYA